MIKIEIFAGTESAGYINKPSDFEQFRKHLVSSGIDSSSIKISGPSIKVWARDQVEIFAESYRAKIAPQSAGKLAEYRIKEEIGSDPNGAHAGELAILDREALARGTDRAGLLEMINHQAASYRQIALLIGALEAEAIMAISALSDDDANINHHVDAILDGAKSAAEAEYQNVLLLISGGQ